MLNYITRKLVSVKDEKAQKRNEVLTLLASVSSQCSAWFRKWADILEIGSAAQNQHREQNNKSYLRRAGRRIAQFRQITSLSDEQKILIWKTIIVREEEQANFYIKNMEVLRRMAIGLAYFTILLASVLLAWDWSNVALNFSSIRHPILVPIYFGLSTLFFLLAVGIPYQRAVAAIRKFNSKPLELKTHVAQPLIDKFFIRLFRIAYSLLGAYAIIFILMKSALPRYDYLDTRFYSLTFTAISAASTALYWAYGLCLYLSCVAVFLALVQLVGNSLHEAKHPESVVTSRLSELLYTIESEPTQWEDADFKKSILTMLERIASCTEHHLPRRLASGDAVTDAWMKEQASEMAQTFRTWKKWILMPMSDTREFLIGCIGFALVSFATGTWDAVEKTPVDLAAREKLWHFRLLSLGRSFLIGCVISGFVVVIRRLPGIYIPSGWVYLGPAYVLLMLAYAIAPELVSSVAIFKGIKDLISPEKK